MEGLKKHRYCKVTLNDNFITEGTVTECCRNLGFPNWQCSISQKFNKGLNPVLHHGYQFTIGEFIATPKNERDPRLLKSYESAIQHCKAANVTLLTDINEWRGITEKVGDKYRNIQYKVKCTCGYEYETYFKPSKPLGKGLMQCPICHGGQRSKLASLVAVQRELKSQGILLLPNQDWKGRSHEYEVECMNCGIKFHTSLRRNHFNNCPYCHESSHKENQIPKLDKLCKDNLLELLDRDYVPGLTDGRHPYKVRCTVCNTVFEARFIGKQVTNCPVCCQRNQRSQREKLMCAYLDELKIPYFANYRLHGLKLPDSSQPCELDIYIPSLKIAFEFNGQAYHNTGEGLYHKSKEYHRNKTDLFLSQGIKLYHLWDFESDELVKSIIASKCGKTERIFARKCVLSEIDANQAKLALTKWHADGYVRSNKYYALFYKERMVAVLTLLNRRIQSIHKSVWEIGRYATTLNTTVVGGYSKLLKHAIEYLKSIGVTNLVSYCNRDLSPDANSTFYAKQGFTLEQDSGLIYWYWASKKVTYRGTEIKRGDKVSRQKLQKQLLLKHYEEEGLQLPNPCNEKTLAAGLGLYPVYNSGNWKYNLLIKD